MATEKSTKNLAVHRAMAARDKILDLLRLQIEESGKTNVELGTMAQVDQSFIWRIRTGDRGPGIRLINILKVYYALNSSNDPLFKILLESE